MPDKPMTPKEFAKEIVHEDDFLWTNHETGYLEFDEDKLAKWITAYTESIRREAKREELEKWLEFAVSKGWDGAIAITNRDFEKFRQLPVDTPPAADRAPEAVCPRCEGNKVILTAYANSPITSPCPSCHGTGKQSLEDKK